MLDVCLVVEGSYPYVTGGVSAWTDGLLRGLPDVSFAVAHVRDAGDPELTPAYGLPGNARLVHVDRDPDEARPQAGLHRALPEARVYHAACTGAAGELARLAAAEQGGAFALTEHGLAWREARWGIDACKPGTHGCKPGTHGCKPGTHGAVRSWTLEEHRERADAVLAMAMEAYAAADAVTSVCGPNAVAQRRLGATGARMLPNPVAAGPARAEHDGFLVGFVGRVVEVKDVRSFLEACALVAARRDDARFVVVGPLDHEPEYAQACREHADALGLGDRVEFTGTTDPAPWMAQLDVLALTSLSEAQPLVALEAMAAGVPVVATDVGGCREALGTAGLLTPTQDPAATAEAVLRIAGDELLRSRMAAEGRRRAAAHHDPVLVHRAYGRLYERLAA